jgi:hypothetical protein
VAEAMTARGWFVGRQAEPPGIHMHLNPVHAVAVDRYLDDLAAAVREVRGRSVATVGAAGATY